MALELNKIRSSQINEKVSTTQYDIIYPETRADLVKETFGAKASLWEAQKSYIVGDNIYVVDDSGAIASYECISAHTSGNNFVVGNEWQLIVSRRFVTPADEIAWSEGGVALKFRGSYSAAYTYKQHDLVVYKDGSTGQEQYFISLVDENLGVTPSLEGHNANWRNLNIWSTHAIDADKVRVASLPGSMTDGADNVYLTFVVENNESAPLYSDSKLVYEVNSNKLHVLAQYAESYMKAFDNEGNDVTPAAMSINDEFKAIYATIKTISGGNLVLGHGLTIKLNGETLINNWKAETDGIVELNLTNASITNWDEAMNDAFAAKGDTRYVRYDAVQELTPEQQAQARTNIGAQAAGNYAVLENGKIKLENLPDTVVGGLQFKGIYDASVAGSIVPEMGDYYIVSVAGNYDPAGGEHEAKNQETYYFLVGDWAIYNGAEQGWAKIDNTDAVKTVNGQIGAVQTYKGEYSVEADYYAGDWVTSGGILYLAVEASKGEDPVTSTKWQVAGRIYEGQDGIEVNGNVIRHTAKHVAEAAEEKAVAANGGQFSVDVNEYDAQGHVVKTKPQNITLSQTWREVKVGETVVAAKDAEVAVSFVGNAPIAVEGDAAAHAIYVKHNEGTEVKEAINLTVEGTGAVVANIVSSDKFGHVNGTRELKLANLALKDGEQTLSGVKTYKNETGAGAVILPETTEVYDLGSTNAKFRNVYAATFTGGLEGNAATASKWLNGQRMSILINAGLGADNVTNLNGTRIDRTVDGSAAVDWVVSLPDSGVKADVYTAVQVNAKGIVVAGAQTLEFGKEVNADPSSSLAVGGLFFRMVASN